MPRETIEAASVEEPSSGVATCIGLDQCFSLAVVDQENLTPDHTFTRYWYWNRQSKSSPVLSSASEADQIVPLLRDFGPLI